MDEVYGLTFYECTTFRFALINFYRSSQVCVFIWQVIQDILNISHDLNHTCKVAIRLKSSFILPTTFKMVATEPPVLVHEILSIIQVSFLYSSKSV